MYHQNIWEILENFDFDIWQRGCPAGLGIGIVFSIFTNQVFKRSLGTEKVFKNFKLRTEDNSWVVKTENWSSLLVECS